ncbi:DNA primase family protein [Streptomyces iconiensis]|uniref:DNA primase family protein n=1 Tax=Streptomyces iconiensis TaxID=1384038 RepID=UPI003D2F9ACD
MAKAWTLPPHEVRRRMACSKPAPTDTSGERRPFRTARSCSQSISGRAGQRRRRMPWCWYRWSGARWQPDEHESVVWAVGDMAEELATTDPTGTYTDAEMRRERKRAMSTSGIKAVLQQARAARGMRLDASLLDADPYKLCTPGGIVDLTTGSLQPPDPGHDFHSRSALTAPEQMPTPRWDQFLADTFGQDPEGCQMIRYLHLLLGYSVTGDVGAQVLAFLYGQGKNGKPVLLDVIVELLGDYADAAPPGFLMAKTFESHPTGLAELHGRRVIVCSELKAGDRFGECRVKLLTGGDQLKTCRMRQDFFSFTPPQALPAGQPPPRSRRRRLRLVAPHAPDPLRADQPRRTQDR